MKEKRIIYAIGATSLALALGLGWLNYTESGSIDTARQGVLALHTQIEQSRQLLAQTPALEKEVIVMRETEEAIKEILPDEQDLNNFVRDLQRFQDDSEAHITSLKKRDSAARTAKGEQETFGKVAYEIALQADAFQFLAFLDRLESHARFLRVPSISLDAAARRDIENSGASTHKAKLQVETFVYKPQGGPELVKIEGYARKRELLLGEISRHRAAISADAYSYRGQRGRRDPWVDPRMPVASQDPSGLPIQEQSRIVDALVEQLVEVKALWDGVRTPDITIVEQMTLRAELESKLGVLEEETRRVTAEGQVRFPMAESRMRQAVLEPLSQLRNELVASRGNSGPTAEALSQILQSMRKYVDAGSPKLALDAFATIETGLVVVMSDPVRRRLAEALRETAGAAHILLEFDSKELDIKGVAIQEGRPPVALINGKALSEGDAVDDELIIRGIRSGEIEFSFRGVVLVRRF